MPRNAHSKGRASWKHEKSSTYDDINRCFAFSLACPYLFARDILSLSLASSAIRSRLCDGAVKVLRADIRDKGNTPSRHFLCLLSKSFPNAKEVILRGNREELFSALKGTAHLQLKRLYLTLCDKEDETLESTMDGRGLATAIGGFPLLERLQLNGIGPFSPWSYLKTCSGQHLQMIRLVHCPTLTDACLNTLVSKAPSLLELSLEECPSIIAPTLKSTSLTRLRLAHCFSLSWINCKECENLMILDIPFTLACNEARSLSSMQSLRHLSLAGALNLQVVDLEEIPSSLSSIDLSACPKLKSISIGNCVGLFFLDVSFCVGLENLLLQHAHVLEELDLSMLINLQSLSLTEDHSLKRVALYGCDRLPSASVFVNPSCRRFV